MRIKIYFFIILLLTAVLNLFSNKISLTIKYLGFNVVYVTMEDNGSELIITARSSALASIASGMDNHYSVVYLGDYLPQTYAKIIEQKDYQERRIITYNREEKTATLTSFIDSSRNCTYAIHPEARDFFSALFYLGKNLNENGGTIWLDAGNLIWQADYEMVKRETVRSYKGKQEALLVKLDFKKISETEKVRSDMLTNNLVSEDNNLYVWFTDDAERIPVKAKFAMSPFSVIWKVTDHEK